LPNPEVIFSLSLVNWRLLRTPGAAFAQFCGGYSHFRTALLLNCLLLFPLLFRKTPALYLPLSPPHLRKERKKHSALWVSHLLVDLFSVDSHMCCLDTSPFTFFSEQNSCVEPIAKDSLGKVNVFTSKYW